MVSLKVVGKPTQQRDSCWARQEDSQGLEVEGQDPEEGEGCLPRCEEQPQKDKKLRPQGC